MSKRTIKIQTGIEIWDGLPGSGKSYSCVEELIKIIIQQRRPVYTNLPLKMKVLRKLLVIRSLNQATANYIQPLDLAHFTRFIKRNEIWSKFSEPLRAEGYGYGFIDRKFNEMEGQPTITGPDADWIPAGSVLILDEFHRWADQRTQRTEDPAFMLYATMHRHHMHRVIIATQDKMQVSITWRRNSDELVHHTDKRKLPFIFGIPLPIPAFAREYWPKEYMEESTIGKKPTRVEVFVPWFSGGLIWRLYDSFTHMGGARRLQRALAKTREMVEGDQYQAIEEQGEQDVSIKPKAKDKIKKAITSCIKLAIIAAIMLWLYSIKKQAREQAERSEKVMVGLQSQITHMTHELENIKTQPQSRDQLNGQPNPPTVSMITSTYCMANGQICKLGQDIEGYTLEKVNHENSTTVWSKNGNNFSVPLERLQPTATASSHRANG
ncbi:MAG: hypothetical protein CMJ19_05085, partial [Phycisphaeraceae bacterium]|nr:hypothetical protein [Phycisphaeraceae bacterium]